MHALAILDVIAPQYKTDPDKDDFISFARGRVSTCVYKLNTEMAVALRAAHMMVIRDRGSSGDGGEIASKREGDLSIAYHKGESDSDLHLTSFGKQLIGLTKGNVAFVGVTGGNDNGCNS